MRKNQEVEKRAILPSNQEKKIREKLRELKAKLTEEIFVKDVYFCPKNFGSFKDIEMNEVGSYSLRTREERVGKKVNRSMNMKVITNRGDHNSWEEHEIGIGSLDEAEIMLKLLGFKSFCKIEKQREKFEIGEAGIFLEKIKDFGLGIEIEILTSKGMTDSAKLQIDELLHKLGVKKSQIAPKSITNIIMREKSDFRR